MNEHEQSIATAIGIFLADRISDHDEFFDLDGREHPLDWASNTPDGTTIIQFEGFIATVTINVREG